MAIDWMQLYNQQMQGQMGAGFNQLQDQNKTMASGLANRGILNSPAAAAAYQKAFQQNYANQMMQMIPQMRLQAAQAQQGAQQWGQQFAESQRARQGQEGMQAQSLAEQVRQANMTNEMAARQQALAERQLQEQTNAMNKQNEMAPWLALGNLAGQGLTMGLYPGAGAQGWLTNIINSMGTKNKYPLMETQY